MPASGWRSPTKPSASPRIKAVGFWLLAFGSGLSYRFFTLIVMLSEADLPLAEDPRVEAPLPVKELHARDSYSQAKKNARSARHRWVGNNREALHRLLQRRFISDIDGALRAINLPHQSA